MTHERFLNHRVSTEPLGNCVQHRLRGNNTGLSARESLPGNIVRIIG